jgi:hypothetical protein
MAVGFSEPDGDDLDSSTVGAARFGAMVERWNGHRWGSERVFGVTGDDFSGVSCASPRACMAVGPDAEPARWNGRTWSLVRGLKLVATGVSCVAADDCLVVGWALTRRQPAEAEGWNGSRWDAVSRLQDPGDQHLTAAGVSCASARNCWAVGKAGMRHFQALVEHWNGSQWLMQPTPRPAHRPAAISWELNAVTCLKAAGCTAVGDYEWPSSGLFEALLTFPWVA